MRLARRGNHEKVLACADQTLSARTGQALQASCDVLNSIEEADQVFPGEVVDEQSDGGCNQKRGRSNGGRGGNSKTRQKENKRGGADRQGRGSGGTRDVVQHRERHAGEISEGTDGFQRAPL